MTPQAEIDLLRAQLRQAVQYGRHHNGCAFRNANAPCDCGWHNVRAFVDSLDRDATLLDGGGVFGFTRRDADAVAACAAASETAGVEVGLVLRAAWVARRLAAVLSAEGDRVEPR